MSDDIDADRDAAPEAHHEASEISYDEQFYPARPRRLRPRARLRLFPRLIGGRNGRSYGGNAAYVTWLESSRCWATPN